jgi:xylulose-5-phosphate/fructose-6-phosphate phosphoketolase
MTRTLSRGLLQRMNAYWRAANYLSVGQIYLMDNPLLKTPLRPSHIKPRLLGHWGTTPGLNFVYVHLNRLIAEHDLDMILVVGPGHGGPAIVANTYLEGTYSELYPNVSRDEAGLKRLFTQFSFPGGIPSHCAPETPGSINEGGELGYSLTHAYGAAFDNPNLFVTCIIGDGEAETGALATSWHSNKFFNPARDGAVLPVLHLNGYKIAGPTVLARIGRDELGRLLTGYGYEPVFVGGDDPMAVHPLLAGALERALDPVGGACPGVQAAAGMAGHRVRDAEGLDRAQGRRRRPDRRNVPRPPGAARRGADQALAPQDPRAVDEELQAGRALRRERNPRPAPVGAGAEG